MQKVTIGVPVYNEEDTLRSSLDSILASAENLKNPHNIVLCFNGTTDRGPEIAMEYDIICLESRKGKTSAVRRIADYSDSDILLYVDADALVQSDCFRNLIGAFTAEVMAVTGRPIPYENDSLIYKILNARMRNPDLEISRTNGHKPFLHGRIYAVRKNVFEEMGPLFERGIGDDTFLFQRGFNTPGLCPDSFFKYVVFLRLYGCSLCFSL